VVALHGGRLLVNGVEAAEPYLGNGPVASMSLGPTLVPPDHLFVLGDNRSPLGSRDSRVFGAVPIESVGGRAAFVVWPPARRDGLGAPSVNLRPVASR
jgi:signal peptidase I